MAFTIPELTEAISYYEGEMGIGNLFLQIWEEEVDVLPDIPNIGKIEYADTDGQPNDGAEISAVIKIGDRYFEKSGYYSSWGSSTMDGDIVEVRPKQVQVTQYERI